MPKLNMTNPADMDRAFDYLSERAIFKKFMPCYLQGIDLETKSKKKAAMAKQLEEAFVQKYASYEAMWSQNPSMTEEDFIRLSGDNIALDFWQEDTLYYGYRRDLYILDIHELIKLYGNVRKYGSFKDATNSLSRFMAKYIYDLLYDDDSYAQLGLMFKI